MLRFIVLWSNISSTLIPNRNTKFLSLRLMRHILGLLRSVITISQYLKCFFDMNILNNSRVYLCKLDESVFRLTRLQFYCASILHTFTRIPFRLIGSYVR